MKTSMVQRLLRSEIDRLRELADKALREGDLAKASELRYGEVAEIEAVLAWLKMMDASDRTDHHWILPEPDGRTWVAVPLEEVNVRPATRKQTQPGPGWMHVGEALSLEDRRRLILDQVQKALRRGDIETADDLETGALSDVDGFLAKQRCFTLVHDDGRRLILQDGDGIRWIAVELDEVLTSDEH